MVEEVLPDVPYVQIVFTIPKMLNTDGVLDDAYRRSVIKSEAAVLAACAECQNIPGTQSVDSPSQPPVESPRFQRESGSTLDN